MSVQNQLTAEALSTPSSRRELKLEHDPTPDCTKNSESRKLLNADVLIGLGRSVAVGDTRFCVTGEYVDE
jgi:hypothetical protein